MKTTARKRGDRLTWRGVAGVAVVLALALAAVWQIVRPAATPPAGREVRAGATGTPVRTSKVVPAPTGNVAQTQARAHRPTEGAGTGGGDPEAADRPFVKRPGALQLPDGRVLTFPPPREGEIRKVYAHGHLYECDHEGNFTEVTRRQLFKTAFEANFLGLAVADKPFIPAFLTGLDEADVRKLLVKPYEPRGDETEEELAQLRAYDEMRAIALDYMDGGGSFDDFVEAFARQVREERAANAACLREVMSLYRQGKFAEARAAAEAADALKRENGLDPLRLPPHVKDRLGLGK